MLKIDYPEDIIEFDYFCNQYFDALQKEGVIDVAAINAILNNPQTAGVDAKRILTAKFNELIDINQIITDGLNNAQFDRLKSFFNYDSSTQPIIAKFFSQQTKIKLESCFFCNMDHIYSFKDFGDYNDGTDFLNRAHDYELLRIPYVTVNNGKLDYIKTNREFDDFERSSLNMRSKNWLRSFNPSSIKNHFTLDHVLPKDQYKLLSLSLFNLVPCCFPCNSKFKRSKKFTPVAFTSYASPSSEYFTINEDFEFILVYDGNLESLSVNSPIKIGQRVLSNHRIVEQFFWMFKIPGRYTAHKSEAKRLIKLKNNYPQAKIDEIADLLDLPVSEIKQDVFGDVLNNEDFRFKSLSKFKNDIARNIEII